jgi:GNAT superfamily N-acetyltransferase
VNSQTVLLRSAAPDDSLAVAQVHVQSWQVAYRGLMQDEYLDKLRPEDRAKRYDFGASDPSKPSTIVAVDGSVIVGFATLAPATDLDARGDGELCALYVDPERWGRKIGRALIERARTRLSSFGFQRAVLWVMAGNLRAERFYRRDGWEPDGMRRTDSVWGVSVDEIRFRRPLAK